MLAFFFPHFHDYFCFSLKVITSLKLPGLDIDHEQVQYFDDVSKCYSQFSLSAAFERSALVRKSWINIRLRYRFSLLTYSNGTGLALIQDRNYTIARSWSQSQVRFLEPMPVLPNLESLWLKGFLFLEFTRTLALKQWVHTLLESSAFFRLLIQPDSSNDPSNSNAHDLAKSIGKNATTFEKRVGALPVTSCWFPVTIHLQALEISPIDLNWAQLG